MNLTDHERRVLAAVADVFLPATANLPAASDADVAGAHLDAVLAAVPRLGPELYDALQQVGNGTDAAAALSRLQQQTPAAYEVLRTVCGAAYYLNQTVRNTIGYPGQTPTAHTPGNDTAYLDDGLLDHVATHGPRYRLPPNSTSGEQRTEPTQPHPNGLR